MEVEVVDDHDPRISYSSTQWDASKGDAQEFNYTRTSSNVPGATATFIFSSGYLNYLTYEREPFTFEFYRRF